MVRDRKIMEPSDLHERLNGGERLVLVDVRSTEEFEADHIKGAVNIPVSELAARVSELPSDAAIVTVCNLGGARSCGAADQLQGLGDGNAFPLRGGTRGWKDEEHADVAK
jgi:rhodanese-related sulfurtransferase